MGLDHFGAKHEPEIERIYQTAMREDLCEPVWKAFDRLDMVEPRHVDPDGVQHLYSP